MVAAGTSGGVEPQDGIVCNCRGTEQAAYEGNLNFLKTVLTALPPNRRYGKSLTERYLHIGIKLFRYPCPYPKQRPTYGKKLHIWELHSIILNDKI
jgi:hypothetical protein